MQNCELLFLDGKSDETTNVSDKMPPSVSSNWQMRAIPLTQLLTFRGQYHTISK